MNPGFQKLFDYNLEMNTRFIRVFEQATPPALSEKAVLLMSHTLNAHHIWATRIQARPSKFSVWEIHSTERLSAINLENHALSTPFTMMSQDELMQTITYTNTKGDRFKNSIADILYHVINHSTYHRAQIASELKGQGLEVPNSDYIFYARELEI